MKVGLKVLLAGTARRLEARPSRRGRPLVQADEGQQKQVVAMNFAQYCRLRTRTAREPASPPAVG